MTSLLLHQMVRKRYDLDHSDSFVSGLRFQDIFHSILILTSSETTTRSHMRIENSECGTRSNRQGRWRGSCVRTIIQSLIVDRVLVGVIEFLRKESFFFIKQY